MPSLQVEIDGVQHSFTLPEGMPVFIGRARECDIHLPSTGVSRRHAVVMARDGVVGIKDLGSFNGTFVNGKPLKAPAELSSGDEVRISGFSFFFRRSAATSRAARRREAEDAADRERPSGTLRLPRAMTSPDAPPTVQNMFGHIKQAAPDAMDGEDTRRVGGAPGAAGDDSDDGEKSEK